MHFAVVMCFGVRLEYHSSECEGSVADIISMLGEE